VNVNLLPTWICLPMFLYILFIYIYVGVKGVTHHGYQMVIHVVNLILSTLTLIMSHLNHAWSLIISSLLKKYHTWNLHSPLLCTSSSREGGESIFFFFFQASYKCSWDFFSQSFGKRLLIFIFFLFPHHFCAKPLFLVPNFFYHPLKLGNIQIQVCVSCKHFFASFMKGGLSTSWTFILLPLEARLHCMTCWCSKFHSNFLCWNCVICCFYWSF